jgi:phospholipid transport system substrate-binding protein
MTRRPWRDIVLATIALVGAVLPTMAAEAPPGSASDALRPAVDRVLGVLTDPALAGEERRAPRRAALRAAMEGAIDFPDAARRALAVHWAARTPEERVEFVALFENLVLDWYAVQLDTYGVERVVFVGETLDEDRVTVHTRGDSRQRRSVAVDYRMHRRDGRWLVYDVLVEGVSLVANYREQFNTVIRTKSYAELVRRLKGHG